MAETDRNDMTEHNRSEPLADAAQAPIEGVSSVEAQGLPAGVIPPGGPAQGAADILAEREAAGQDQDESAPTEAEKAKADEPIDTKPG